MFDGAYSRALDAMIYKHKLRRGRSACVAAGGGTLLRFELLEPRIQPAAVPLIVELMPSNDSTILDEDGDSSDWLELYNAGDVALDLAGWHLTDDDGNLEKWTFPSVPLAPGEFLLVFASDKDRADADGSELHTNFKLSASGEYVALIEPDGVTVAAEYAPEFPAVQSDVSYGYSMTASGTVFVDDATALTYLIPLDGQLGTTWTHVGFDDSSWNGASGPLLTAGIGYENTPAEYDELIDTPISPGTPSFYSRFEFAVSDPSVVDSLDLGMIYDDGFVAYLNGVKIAESDNAPEMPDWNSTTGSHRPDSVVLEDYVQFDVSDHIGLLQAGTNVLAIHGINISTTSSDMLMIPRLTAYESDVAMPLTVGFFSEPTPGRGNGMSFDGFVEDTAFSVDRGFFTSPIQVEITSATPGAMIVYTLDGSEPEVDPSSLSIFNGQLYTGAIPISETVALRAAAFKAGYEPTNVDTQTYIFAGDVIGQDFQHALDLGMPELWGSRPADYGLNVAAGHESDFTDSLLALPTISIAIDSDELFDANNGIYTNSVSRGRQWERAASVELIYPDGTEGFQEDAGLRIQGGAFRSHSLTRKNSFRLAFRGEYGATKLNYPLFGPDAADEFDNIVLRMEANDGWQWNTHHGKTYARDTFGRETQLAMGHSASHGTRMHVYLNGHYWGLYNPVERPDEGFGETYYGGDKDDYDVIKTGEIQEGTSDAWDTLKSLSQAIADAPSEEERTAIYLQILGMNPDGTPNPEFPVYLDAVNYVDYMIANLYVGNSDWPWNNYALMRDRTANSEGFKFLMWDSEWSLGLNSSLNANRTFVSDGVAEPYNDLRESAEFRTLFSDRVHQHLFNAGALTVPNVIQRFDDITATVEPGLWAESGRWGDQHGPLRTPNHWIAAVNDVRDNYLPHRSEVVVGQFQSAQLYSTVEAVTWNQRGGTVAQNFDISLTAPEGAIYFTLDGSDPRAIGGGLSSSAILYSGPFNLVEPTTVKARVLDGTTWSAVDEAFFESTVPSNEQLHLRITELHYHPAEPDAVEQAAGFVDDGMFEFVELKNTSAITTIDLSNVAFSDGIVASFPVDNLPLPPGNHALVVRDLAAFTFRYGQDVVDAADYVLEYTGQLSNGGEQIRLDDSFGLAILNFSYEDGDDAGEEDWPTAADGVGTSLVVVDSAGDYNDGANWQVSGFPHGTPAADQSERRLGDYDRDQDVDHDDWLFWSAQFGATGGLGLFADGNVNGIVDAADFVIWRDNLRPKTTAGLSPQELAEDVPVPITASVTEFEDVTLETPSADIKLPSEFGTVERFVPRILSRDSSTYPENRASIIDAVFASTDDDFLPLETIPISHRS